MCVQYMCECVYMHTVARAGHGAAVPNVITIDEQPGPRGVSNHMERDEVGARTGTEN